MDEMNSIFEKASRMKLRFQSHGSITVEDLWDLRVENLDEIYKDLARKIKETTEDTLLTKNSSIDEETLVMVEILKYIVKTKIIEAQDKRDAKAKREQKQKLLAILANKQDAELEGKTPTELQAMIDAL